MPDARIYFLETKAEPTRVFRDEMQIHIEKKFIRVFFARKCQGRPEESSVARLEDFQIESSR